MFNDILSGIDKIGRPANLTQHARTHRRCFTRQWHVIAQGNGFKNEYHMWTSLYPRDQTNPELPLTSTGRLGRKFQVAESTILKRINKFKIPKRPKGGANNTKRK